MTAGGLLVIGSRRRGRALVLLSSPGRRRSESCCAPASQQHLLIGHHQLDVPGFSAQEPATCLPWRLMRVRRVNGSYVKDRCRAADRSRAPGIRSSSDNSSSSLGLCATVFLAAATVAVGDLRSRRRRAVARVASVTCGLTDLVKRRRKGE